jgi:hypothetical protein
MGRVSEKLHVVFEVKKMELKSLSTYYDAEVTNIYLTFFINMISADRDSNFLV